MHSPQNDIGRAVAALKQGRFDATQVHSLRHLVKIGSGGELMDKAVSNETATSENNRESISQAMSYLESLAQKDELIACILMAYLWPHANRCLMHDICDAIDLWIDHCESPELRIYLESLVQLQTNSGVSKHYRSWLENRNK